jgi:hypothetical protein
MNEKEKKAVELVKKGERVEKVALALGVNLFWLQMVTGHER